MTSGRSSWVNTDVAIYLEDRVLENMVNLRQDPHYSFNYEPGSQVDRFFLHFTGAIAIEDIDAGHGLAYCSDGHLFIDVPGMHGQEADILVYNILGQEIISEHVSMNGIVKINVPEGNHFLVIHVFSSDQHFSTKVLHDQ